MPTAIGTKLVTARFGNEDARTLAGYEKTGGYQALRKALAMRPEDITNEVKASNLRGRGGAGFATGVKWGFVPKDAKARPPRRATPTSPSPAPARTASSIYWDPHLLIEGMIISALRAQGRAQLHLHPRRDDARVRSCSQKAVDEAYAARLPRQEHPRHARLRVSHHGAPRRRRVHLRRGDGAAQLARGPARPAAPQAAVPGGQGPVRQPDDRQQRRDADERAVHHRQGRRLVQRASAPAARAARASCACRATSTSPACSSCRWASRSTQIINDVCGGVWKGRKVEGRDPGRRVDAAARRERARRAVRVRRAADRRAHQARDGQADQQFDLGGGRALRTMAGSGGIVVMDDQTDIPKALWRILKFFAHESCGQCTPCREGTGWLEKVSRRVADGQRQARRHRSARGDRARHRRQHDLRARRCRRVADARVPHQVPRGLRGERSAGRRWPHEDRRSPR